MEEEATTVLFVFNGQYNFTSPTDWNVDELVAMKASRARVANEAENDEENTSDHIPRRKSKKSRLSED